MTPFIPSPISEVEKMSELIVPDFETYEDEAEFWDKFDTADFMPDDGE